MAHRVIAVDKLSLDELYAEARRTAYSASPGGKRRYQAVQKEVARREARTKRTHERERRSAERAASRPRKRQRSTLEVEALRASKSVARGRFITTKMDEHGNTIEIETKSDTPSARARRYPGVIGAYARLLAIDTERTRLRTKASKTRLSDAEHARVAELKSAYTSAYRDYTARYDRALATEKKRAAAVKRAAPKPPKKVTKVSRRRDYRPSAVAAQHHEALESLLAAQRAYRADRTDANAQRVRRAQTKLKEAQAAIDAARAANR